MAKAKKKWKNGDIFIIPLVDGSFGMGQVLDLQMPNIARIALFDFKGDNLINDIDISLKNVISLLSCTIDKLNNGGWEIIDYKPIEIPPSLFPNEQLRHNRWIGAITYGSAIVEKFLNAFYGLVPWDDWADPYYLDNLLFSTIKKPNNIIYTRNS